jgi:hypothetical protein
MDGDEDSRRTGRSSQQPSSVLISKDRLSPSGDAFKRAKSLWQIDNWLDAKSAFPKGEIKLSAAE